MAKVRPCILLILIALLSASTGKAQVGDARHILSVGASGGVNLNSASFSPSVKQQSMMGITAGLTGRYISEKYFAMICGAQVELNISQRGWNQLFEITSTNDEGISVTQKDPSKKYLRKMTYVDIPFLAHLAFGNERGLQFFIHAGPQIGFLLSETETISGIDMNKLNDTQKALYTTKADNKFDYGIAGGGGLEFNARKVGRFLLEGRYYFALSDFYSTTKKDYFSRAAHGTITVKLTYLFDLKR
ncbi:MAG: PorT family protein [Mediterranea sp.]|jgi:hypothetical protein|nr:PorT family protein [Mediterranea sp.]